ncbi:hypothetical protein DEA8626_01356 [Defluviimonas aquaemixtae]|uniref:Hcy-binding domain-containing protein n=1 Tax=Albidovulum aquaemixtae TaxID=1542388 RepID=A0A2R8B5E4_9RHOB|nr:homocysteine S-methyltransferase family protein [Defluviimonas aquaemixtae]SPH17829.1 hypothetical protein DEA8626_01356 [Defluviimonas aquaemixtae]
MTRLEQLTTSARPYLTDGGLETTMVFHESLELPEFAAFTLLDSEEGRDALTRYYETYLKLAREARTGFVLDLPTWRANSEWGRVMGLGEKDIRRINRDAVAFCTRIRDEWETAELPIVINGVVGPSGDGYVVGDALSPEKSESRHRVQAEAYAEGGVDIVTAVTMTHSGEAIGIARAAIKARLPFSIGFTVETDGKLPSGETIGEAIRATEDATDGAAVSFMINCAHPTHFMDELAGEWTGRIGAIRANASRKSHEELDAAEELDDGDPEEFGQLYSAFAPKLPNLRVIGGCCGTDHRHVGCASAHFHGTVAA